VAFSEEHLALWEEKHKETPENSVSAESGSVREVANVACPP
jgi:hypothetical protein